MIKSKRRQTAPRKIFSKDIFYIMGGKNYKITTKAAQKKKYDTHLSKYKFFFC